MNTGTNPHVYDSDNDGYFDEQELAAGSNPVLASSTPEFPIPIGYWPFDDQGAVTTADLSSNANHAAVNGAATYTTGHTGAIGDSSLNFDGIDDSATTALSLNGLNSFTMAGWVQFDVDQTSPAGLFGQNDIVEFGMSPATTLQLWSDPGGRIDYTIAHGTWRHIAVTGDTTGRTVYVDGVIASSGVAGTPLATSTYTFNIGGGGIFTPTADFFIGQIDDVAVWDTALSQALVIELANGTRTPIEPDDQDLLISFVDYNSVTNRVTISTTGTAPSAPYEVYESSDLINWSAVHDFTGAAGETSTTEELNGPDVIVPEMFYRVGLSD